MTIALIAHNGKKAELVQFLLNQRSFLNASKLIATGTTGSHIEKAGLAVKRMLSGPEGGDAQIAALASEKKIDAVIFFRDPLDKHPHEPDVQMLMRICDVHNVPLATNPATATLVLKSLAKK